MANATKTTGPYYHPWLQKCVRGPDDLRAPEAPAAKAATPEPIKQLPARTAAPAPLISLGSHAARLRRRRSGEWRAA